MLGSSRSSHRPLVSILSGYFHTGVHSSQSSPALPIDLLVLCVLRSITSFPS